MEGGGNEDFESAPRTGGIEDGGAVWTFPPGGGGGTKGIFLGGTTFSDVGVGGVGTFGEASSTGPGGAGCGVAAVWLLVPGSTTASGS